MHEPPTTDEIVNGLPVLAETRDVTPAEPAPLPAKQAAALAVSGFAAGAATVVLAHRRRARVVAKRAGKRKKGLVGEIVGSNSFLVDVHLIKRT